MVAHAKTVAGQVDEAAKSFLPRVEGDALLAIGRAGQVRDADVPAILHVADEILGPGVVAERR